MQTIWYLKGIYQKQDFGTEEDDKWAFREIGINAEDLIQLAQNKFQLWFFIKQWRILSFLNEELIFWIVIIYQYFMGNYDPWSI